MGGALFLAESMKTPSRCFLTDYRQSHDGCRSPIRLRLEFQCPVMVLDDHVGDCEPQAGAPAVELGGEKRLEKPAPDLIGHAAAGIAHSYDGPIGTFIKGGGDPDYPFLVWEGLEGVHDKVDNDLLQLLRIAPDG